MSHVRHGVCINGSSNPQEVIKTVTDISGDAESVVITVDPKNSLTRVGGALHTVMRTAGSKSSKVLVFLVLPPAGGSVPAPVLLEQLNSLFDDNKKVVFDNDEVVRMTDNTGFFVVTDDCSHFSPASVSRLG